jgi:hypothetical protein
LTRLISSPTITARHPSTFASAISSEVVGSDLSCSQCEIAVLVAHCHLGLGKLYRRTGKREQAQEHLTTATTMYREMGMTYWLEQAEAELRQCG